MLADYSLDTEEFQEIMEEAKNMAAGLYPGWTDFNYHDPGITMLELFAWMKEGQQYYLDQVGPEHKEKYLKLLGVSRQHRKAAGAYVTVWPKADVTLLKGTKLRAGSVLFETTRRQCMVRNRITECFHAGSGLEHDCIGAGIESNINLRLPVFGEDPKPGDTWYIGLEKGLPVQETVGIHISFAGLSHGRRRNPVNGPFYAAMLNLRYEYYAAGGWHTVEWMEDHTYGMVQDGMLYLNAGRKMESVTVCGRTAYYIRICVLESDVDLPPVLEKIRFNELQLIQKDTWVECEEQAARKQGEIYTVRTDTALGAQGDNVLYIKQGNLYYPAVSIEKKAVKQTGEPEFSFRVPEYLHMQGCRAEVLIVNSVRQPEVHRCLGVGDGLPGQEYLLPCGHVLYESVEILVHEIGSRSGYARWERVIDFGASGFDDRHFTVDTESGRVCFGDCEHGMAPEGEILLISFARTSGEEGNVKQGMISRFDQALPVQVQVQNRQDASGGAHGESIEECFLRARKALKSPDTAVSDADYERLVRETPGLAIAGCRVVSADDMRRIQEQFEENTMIIVVKAEGRRMLPDFYRRNILAYLEQYRMLGTRIEIIAPQSIRLEVFLDIVVKPQYRNAKKQVGQAVESYFERMSGEFGATVAYHELYGMLDRLECVAAVNSITLDVRDGKVERAADGSVFLPPNGVVELKQAHYRLS